MTIMEMLGQSGVLTVFGMGVVFSFLIVLIAAITCAGKIINALESGKGKAAKTVAAVPSVSIVSGDADRVTAAISAALTEYRKTKK